MTRLPNRSMFGFLKRHYGRTCKKHLHIRYLFFGKNIEIYSHEFLFESGIAIVCAIWAIIWWSSHSVFYTNKNPGLLNRLMKVFKFIVFSLSFCSLFWSNWRFMLIRLFVLCISGFRRDQQHFFQIGSSSSAYLMWGSICSGWYLSAFVLHLLTTSCKWT